VKPTLRIVIALMLGLGLATFISGPANASKAACGAGFDDGDTVCTWTGVNFTLSLGAIEVPQTSCRNFAVGARTVMNRAWILPRVRFFRAANCQGDSAAILSYMGTAGAPSGAPFWSLVAG
jgi:hypothetical protein